MLSVVQPRNSVLLERWNTTYQYYIISLQLLRTNKYDMNIIFSETYNTSQPFIVYGLLEHEQKMSVLHVILKRHQTSTVPIKSKERMVFHVGPRRFFANPIYSQHTNSTKFKVGIDPGNTTVWWRNYFRYYYACSTELYCLLV